MTREEQIKKQADIYTDDASNYTEWSDDGGWSDTNDIDLVEKAFIEGAKWADDNPKEWISIKDYLPEQNEEVIVLCDELNTAPCYKIAFGHTVDKTICKDYNGWNIPGVVYWFPMPKLPKE